MKYGLRLYDLNAIYDRTSGYCHICHRKLAFYNYGIVDAKGAWEVEHSRPRALGGTHHGNNKYAACIPCNREKGHRFSTRTMRARNGDRKSTRLNSSHVSISYAVFCLKKKKNKIKT